MPTQPDLRMVDPTTLKPHPKNPRVHSAEAVTRMEGAIEKFGFTVPIVVSADGYIIAGERRWKAALRKKELLVPAIFSPLSGAQAVAYMIADNRLQDDTDWEPRLLHDLLGGLDTDLYAATGFTHEEAEELLKRYEAAQAQNAVNPAIGGARGPREVLAGDPATRTPEPETSFLTFSVTESQRHLVQTALTVALNELSSQDQAQALVAVCKAYIKRQP